MASVVHCEVPSPDVGYHGRHRGQLSMVLGRHVVALDGNSFQITLLFY